MRRIPFAAFIALMLAVPACAQQPPDATALLGKMGRVYHDAPGYRYQGTLTVRMEGQGEPQNLEIPIVSAGAPAGKVHLEMRHPQMGVTLISDGRQTWTYAPQYNQFTVKSTDPPPDSAAGRATRPPQGSPLSRYFDPTGGLRAATVTGSASLDVNGRASDCWLVRCDYTPPQALASDTSALAVTTFWVDKQHSIVLRDSTYMSMRNPTTTTRMQMAQVSSYSVAEVGGTAPDSLFAFATPAGASQVERFGPQQGPEKESPLVGKPAPPITLTDLKGRTVSLAAYKGKVVVLDFWATWCGPCRIEMPRVQKLHTDLKSKGLVVLGVNVSEDPKTVKAFLAKNPSYTFNILLDKDGKVSNQYKADAIPTLVVIGKDGKVRSWFQGVREEQVLRDAVAKAGIK